MCVQNYDQLYLMQSIVICNAIRSFVCLKGLVWGTGQAMLRSPIGQNASRDGLVNLGWVHCLQYTLNCFQYNVCDLCRCEPFNYQLTLHNVI